MSIVMLYHNNHSGAHLFKLRFGLVRVQKQELISNAKTFKKHNSSLWYALGINIRHVLHYYLEKQVDIEVRSNHFHDFKEEFAFKLDAWK